MKRIIELLLFLLILNSSAIGQALPDGAKQTSVTIYNSADQDMSILIGEGTSTMKKVIIKKQDTWIGPVYTKNPIIKINTLKDTIIYQLELQKSYIIIWNEERKHWDIKQGRKE